MQKLIWLLPLSIIVSLVSVDAAPAGFPVTLLEREKQKIEWHKLFMRGQPAGYMRVTELPQDEGGYLTRTFMKLVISRGGVSLTLEALEQVEEDARGGIRGFVLEQKMSRNTTVIQGQVKGTTLEVTTTVPGAAPRKTELPLDTSAIGPHRIEVLMKKRLKKEGDTIEVKAFVAEIQRASSQKVTMGPLETTDCLGKQRRLRKIVTQLELLPGNPITLWCDDEFSLVKSSIPMMGMELVSHRSTQKDVLAADYSNPPEIFFSSAVPVDKKVPARARRAVYRLTHKSANPAAREALTLPGGAGQKVIRKEPGAWTVEVLSKTPKKPLTLPLPPDKKLRPFLDANAYVQSDDQKIIQLARKIVAGDRDSWQVALKLKRWVHKNIKKKNLETGFATAKEVADRLEGDCTEHAVLLAALARAVGIPSRVVAGLLGYNRTFVGHMWTEVYCGEWIPVDGTLPTDRVGADHIALANSPLSTATISELFLGLASTLGNLDLEVLEVD